jgi:DNA-binding phage protein
MADVARAYGCSHENIAQLVGGDRDLRLGTVGKLCKAIGLKITIQIEE